MDVKNINYNTKTILNLYKEYPHLKCDAYRNGNIHAVEVIADLDLLLDSANLTPNQYVVFDYYYRKGFTQQETADELGVSRIAVLKALGFAEKKILNKVKEWGE